MINETPVNHTVNKKEAFKKENENEKEISNADGRMSDA